MAAEIIRSSIALLRPIRTTISASLATIRMIDEHTAPLLRAPLLELYHKGVD